MANPILPWPCRTCNDRRDESPDRNRSSRVLLGQTTTGRRPYRKRYLQERNHHARPHPQMGKEARRNCRRRFAAQSGTMMRMSLRIDPTTHEWAGLERVIVFDGICNWCNAWINFTMARDRGRFHFATLQSDKGQELLKLLELPAQDFETFVLLERGRVFTKSTAALRITGQLSGGWPLLSLFCLIPRPLRDVMYNYVARHRYRLMGKAPSCRVPTAEERSRFV